MTKKIIDNEDKKMRQWYIEGAISSYHTDKELKSYGIQGDSFETSLKNNPWLKDVPEIKKLMKGKKEPKTYKESNIMKARTDLKKEGSKYAVDTDMNIKNDLEPKVKFIFR